MKILLLTTHIEIGGIGVYTVNLAKHLKRNGTDVAVASSGGGLEHVLDEEGVPHFTLDIRTKSELGLKLWKSVIPFSILVREKGFDIIHAQTRVAQVLAGITQKLTGIPFVSTCHGFFRYQKIGRRIFPCWGRRVIAISRKVEEHLIRDFGVSPRKVVQIHNGIELDRFKGKGQDIPGDRALRAAIGLKDGMRIIGTVGRFSSVKGHHYLIKAFSRVLDHNSMCQLLLVGDKGPEKKKLEALTVELGILESVIFEDGSRAALEKYLGLIDIFCLPSLQEGLGISLMEAMASGCACIASDVGGVSELIDPGENGILVGPGDPGALSKEIIRLIDDEPQRDRLSRNARYKAISGFSINVSVRETKKVYEEVLRILPHGKSCRSTAGAGKILVYELNWLGDILFSVPMLRVLKKNFPGSLITCAVVPRYAALLENNPYVDSVIKLSDKRGIFSFSDKNDFLRRIKRERFDMCFLLKPSASKTIMAVLAGIPKRVGFSGKKGLLTSEVALPESGVHRVDQLLLLAKAAGVESADTFYEYPVKEKNILQAGMLIGERGSKGGHIVVMNPGGNWDAKRWGKENFIELARGLINDYGNITVIITGAAKDIPLAEKIVAGCSDERCFSVAGKTNIDTLAALFKESDVVVSADSGPLHLASAAGARTIGLFGPTSPKITGTRGRADNVIISHDPGCRVPCYEEVCGKAHACMKLIKPSEVLEEVKKILDRPMPEGIRS